MLLFYRGAFAQQGTAVTEAERRRTIDPRHRARDGSLLGFTRELNPQEFEWQVDKLSIIVNGTWRTPAAEEFFREQLGIPSVDWFTSPTLERGNLVVSTVRRENSSLGNLRLSISQLHQPQGGIKVALDCNPTRTFAHILATAPDNGYIFDYLHNLDALEFFSLAPASHIALSLDDKTNWLRSPQLARQRLGGSINEMFLPVFATKLKSLLTLLLGTTSRDDGNDQVMDYNTGASARLHWGQIRVPQIESYFERHHSSAVAAVRRASMKVLAADHTSTATMYRDNPEFERDQDCFKLSLPIMEQRKLVIYAKTHSRIRFEVRRDKKGRYGRLPPPTGPIDRLLNIIAL